MTDEWDITALTAECAAAHQAQELERAAKFDALVRPAYAGRLLRLPGEGRTYAKRKKRARPRPEPEPRTRMERQQQLTAAYLRELRRLHDAGVLSAPEVRELMCMPDPPSRWRRLFGAKDTRDLGGYGV
jgi:hypothetical protein